MRLAKYSSISRREIRSLGWKSDKIIENEKIKKNPELNIRWQWIEDVFSVYLNELVDLESENEARRLEFEAPAEILAGLQMLSKPVRWRGEMIGEKR
ncbi:MAG: hypothetical protein NTX97_10950 [Bacteroidetes bacterium]|nr:hypothetical protein [Bacteroidota bacterium]